MTTWRNPKTAPKDGTQILAVFKIHIYPMPLMASWSGANEQWCAAVPNVGMYDGEWSDWYFENEYFDDVELAVWAEVPITCPK